MDGAMWYDSLVRCVEDVMDLIFDRADFIACTNLLGFRFWVVRVGSAWRLAGSHGAGNLA